MNLKFIYLALFIGIEHCFTNMELYTLSIYLSIYLSINVYIYLSDERFGAKLRVTENRCVVFDFSTYVCFALLPQH